MGKGDNSPTKDSQPKQLSQRQTWARRAARGSQSQARQLSPEPEKGAGRNPVRQHNNSQAAQFKNCPPNPDNNIEETREHKDLSGLLAVISDGAEEVLDYLEREVPGATDVIATIKSVIKATAEATEKASKANAKAIKSIKEQRKDNLKAVQKEVIIKNVSKTGPVSNINKVKDSVVKHLNTEARKNKMETLNPNQVSVTKLSWTQVDKDGNKEDKFGAHKVTINAKVDYRKLMFSNLGKTAMRKDLGDRISVKNMIPKHLLARSKHLEKVAEKLRREKKKQTKVTLKDGGLFLFTRERGDKEWRQEEEKSLTLPAGRRERQRTEDEQNDD